MDTKISSRTATEGRHGEVSLAGGDQVAMRMRRDEPVTDDKPSASRTYETVCFVISGRAELMLNSETVTLEPGGSRFVPAGAEHTYKILETFTAIEATALPAA